MFDVPGKKVFKDSVHGYINVPQCFVKHLIDTEVFQRLRNIDQTGMRVLYPNAKHDRFGHSLGVFHLGCKAVDALLENFSNDDYWNIRSDSKKLVFWAKNKVLFLIACLLHDIGHAPFSHSLENIVLDNSEGDSRFLQRLVYELNRRENWGENVEENHIKAASHEEIGAFFIMEKMEDAIESVIDDLIQMNYPSVGTDNILYAEHYNYKPTIDKEGFQRDVCFIARMILGLKYTGFEPEKQIRNCFIELLNGSNFDVDKLDYVIRDTQMSGISNINVDVERLLGSVCIITKTKYINKRYQNDDFTNTVISKLSGDTDSEVQIKGHFLGNISLWGGSEVEIAEGSTFLSLSPIDNAKIKYKEHVRGAEFSVDTTVIQDGKDIQWIYDTSDKMVKRLEENNGNFFDCNISNAKVVNNKFCFIVQSDDGPFHRGVEIGINGNCDIKIKGRFDAKAAISCFKGTRLSGCVREIILLGNNIKRNVPDEQMYNEFSVGFKKQAINVIANLLEARNYLYLWVYAHHKVIYYANFLIPVISCEALRQTRGLCQSLKEKINGDNLEREYSELLSMWSLDYADIQYLDDAYLWTIIKKYYYKGLFSSEEWGQLCGELLSRKYKVSLYKSLAEYDLLFESFTETQRDNMRSHLCDHIRQDMPLVMEEGDILAGYLDESIMCELNKNKDLNKIRGIVCVCASYKVNKLNVDETFIEMNEESVAPISEIPLLSDRVTQSKNSTYYFYLYYDTSTKDIKERKKESLSLKEAIKTYFMNMFDNTDAC